jgi:hypothetical protein
MFEEARLSEQFRTLLGHQQQVAQQYAAMVNQTTNPKLKKQVQQLHREKQRDIELTQRLLEIVD